MLEELIISEWTTLELVALEGQLWWMTFIRLIHIALDLAGAALEVRFKRRLYSMGMGTSQWNIYRCHKARACHNPQDCHNPRASGNPTHTVHPTPQSQEQFLVSEHRLSVPRLEIKGSIGQQPVKAQLECLQR
jgi:hypothetical protein